MSTPRTPYLYVDEGRGKTYTFAADSPSYIGTNKLITCVGVYLPISDSRCFFAHINASARKLQTDVYYRHVTEQEGQKVRQETPEKLSKHAAENGWSPKDVGKCVADGGGRKVVLMCPCYDDVEDGNKTLVGKYVDEGIRDFLRGNVGVFKIEEHFRDKSVQGFVVNHQTGEVALLEQRWRRNGKGEDERVNEEDEHFIQKPDALDGPEPWTFDVEAGWWRGPG
ncbi:hypothetical protein PRZ48_000056 [Zasmidium cellare]|uniref:Uncharacterized protein n=1 Tax=Zasmidium cellare TaxID=395010 RepID=A0ABR0EXF4_ZASCE|nr:hypothetical protein PRZ48_000056 [Zasmidium cellare]